jgi:hypothetical protein
LNSVGAHERRPLPQPERATLVRIGSRSWFSRHTPLQARPKRNCPIRWTQGPNANCAVAVSSASWRLSPESDCRITPCPRLAS